METQASAPATAQVQPPVNPEQAIHERLTQFVSGNPDNDPHDGTDLESPKADAEQDGASKQEEQTRVEFDEETPAFEIEYKTDSGKESRKLSLKDLREGYLAKQDYHRNIQKVKQQEAQIAQHVEQARLQAQQDYVQRLESHKQLVLKTVAPELQNVDLNKLAAEDPAEAQRLFFRQIAINQALQAIEAEQRTAVENYQKSQQQALKDAAVTAWSTLEEKVPEWNQQKYQSVLKVSVDEYGFDASQVVHPGLLQALHDASQYRSLQKAKPEIEKRIVTVPKVLKPGSAEQPSPETSADKAFERVQKTGKLNDAVSAYLARQNNKKRK